MKTLEEATDGELQAELERRDRRRNRDLTVAFMRAAMPWAFDVQPGETPHDAARRHEQAGTPQEKPGV